MEKKSMIIPYEMNPGQTEGNSFFFHGVLINLLENQFIKFTRDLFLKVDKHTTALVLPQLCSNKTERKEKEKGESKEKKIKTERKKEEKKKKNKN